LTDVDSLDEKLPGMFNVDVQSGDGAVSLSADAGLEVIGAAATTSVSLSSQSGTVAISDRPGTRASIVAPNELAVEAGRDVTINGDIAQTNAFVLHAPRAFLLPSGSLAFTLDELVLESNTTLFFDGSLNVTGNLELTSNRGNVVVSGLAGTPDSISLIARGNRMESGVAAGLYAFRDSSTGAIYYQESPDAGVGPLYSIVGGMLAPAASGGGLQLAPYLVASRVMDIDPSNGFGRMLATTGPTAGKVYLKDFDSGAVYQIYEAISGLYRFRAFDLNASSFLDFYATTPNPLDGVVYAANKTTVVTNPQDYEFVTQMTQVADPASLGLTPLPDGTAGTVRFKNMGVSEATDSIRIDAQSDLVGLTGDVSTTAAGGSIVIRAGGD
ncbi:MAG TPA: hypothetical protein PLV92_27795, partial [Pirellulaceae bacterium]|nr:hypothetical protein [Pirellulaceae bacterium]